MAKVLLIDDSWLTRRGLKGMLKSTGHEIFEAENGKEGINLVLKNPPDCIFLDLLMPEMDGFEVLQNLNKKEIKIPVVVCTADIQETAKKKCMDLNAFGFLNKPPKEEDVLQAVNNALQL